MVNNLYASINYFITIYSGYFSCLLHILLCHDFTVDHHFLSSDYYTPYLFFHSPLRYFSI